MLRAERPPFPLDLRRELLLQCTDRNVVLLAFSTDVFSSYVVHVYVYVFLVPLASQDNARVTALEWQRQ